MNNTSSLISGSGNSYNLTNNEQYVYDKINKKRKSFRSVTIITKPDTSFFKRCLVNLGLSLFPILPKSLQCRIVKSIDIIKYNSTGEFTCLPGTVENNEPNWRLEDKVPFQVRKFPYLKILALSVKSIFKFDITFEDVGSYLHNSICCRHLVEAYNNFQLACGKDKFRNISTPKKLAAYFKSYKELDINNRIKPPPSFKGYISLEKADFKESMYNLIDNCFKQDKDITVSYDWHVRAHIMGLRVMKKGDKVVATMYDPVNSIDHSRFVFTNAEAAKQLTVKDFIPNMLLRKIYDTDNHSDLYSRTLKP